MGGNKSYRILVAEPFDEAALVPLKKVGEVTVLTDSAPDRIVAAIADADALLVRGRAHVTARIIEAAPHLKVIGRASPTVDHIDLRAARRRNISVVYAPHVAVSSTAEFTLGLILSVHKRIPFLDRQVREGKFDTLRSPTGFDLGRQTLGLLGIDPVAEHLSRICTAAFGIPIIYHDPSGVAHPDIKGKSVSLEGLLSETDILSVHLPLGPDTRGIINARRLEAMKRTAILVNASRGGVVDSTALAEALKTRRLGAAALDVFEIEPLPMDHPIRSAPNCILTPHVAGATIDASNERFRVTEDVARVLTGQQPRYPFVTSDGRE